MSEHEENSKRLPWFYRMIMRLPNPTLENQSETVHGLFYILVLPVFVAASPFVSIVVLVFLPTPVNFLVLGLIVGLVFLFFLRIQLRRFLNFLDAMSKKEPSKWNIDKSLKEYLKLIQGHESVKGEESED